MSLSVLRGFAPPEPPRAGEIREVDRIWAHQVLQVFGRVDVELEREQERKLRRLTYEEYRRYRDVGDDTSFGSRVIKQGITVGELSRLLVRDLDESDEWQRGVCSLAIDIGNDLGVVVPSTKTLDGPGPAFRQYRSGETAFLVDQSHVELGRIDAGAAAEALDWYTQRVIEEDLAGDIDGFLDDVRRIARARVARRCC
jgi:hypothetical protein